MLCTCYAAGLRSMLVAAIDDPDKDWDDFAMKIMDVLMDYEEK